MIIPPFLLLPLTLGGTTHELHPGGAGRARLQRSELAVPGSDPGMFEKAAASKADIIFLDCEDAVAPDDKEQARKNIVAGLNEVDWGNKVMMVRINGLDTHYMYRDVVDIVEACPRLDMILIPKVGVPADVYAVDMLVTQIEAAKKRDKRIGFEVLIETALGMANVEAIAQSSKRLEAMSFGVADYAASTRARTTVIGGVNPDYGMLSDKDANGHRDYFWADQWHAAQTRMMVACRAYGLRPIDGPFGDFPIPTAIKLRQDARPCSAMRANGRSIPRRSILPTRSSPRRRPKSPRRAAWSKLWRRPRKRAKAPSRSTAG